MIFFEDTLRISSRLTLKTLRAVPNNEEKQRVCRLKKKETHRRVLYQPYNIGCNSTQHISQGVCLFIKNYQTELVEKDIPVCKRLRE